MKQKRLHFTVRGSGVFPIDMLRYDHAWPFSEEDSHRCSIDWAGDLRDVELVTESASAPTRGRWKSFTWEVVKEEYAP